MKNLLTFKDDITFNSEQVYSVCLRGARIFDKTKPIVIWTKDNYKLVDTPIRVDPTCIATIVSQNHYKFDDLTDKDCIDNYNISARYFGGLIKAMDEIYPDFSMREIVTILRFKIN